MRIIKLEMKITLGGINNRIKSTEKKIVNLKTAIETIQKRCTNRKKTPQNE